MKKLRASNEDKTLFIEKIIERLTNAPKTYLEEFEIDDIVKELCKPPEEVEKPTIKVTSDAYMKMLELVNQSPVECSWHGLVERNRKENTYTVYDILVFPQINSASSTTTDEDDFAEWQTKLIMDINFPIQDLRLHGHSHVNMNVFSSGIDDQYQKDLITKVEDDDYYIFFIMNKKMEICILLYDFTSQIMFEKSDINFEVITADEIDIREWAKKELKENATTNHTTSYKYNKYAKDDYEPQTSYFSRTSSVFRGVNNGSK